MPYFAHFSFPNHFGLSFGKPLKAMATLWLENFILLVEQDWSGGKLLLVRRSSKSEGGRL